MRNILLPLALVAASSPAAADDLVTPDDFSSYASGWTLHFSRDGEPWGSEEFHPDGTVRWQFPTGECTSGIWRPHQEAVCFAYEESPEILCWEMRRSGGPDSMVARLVGDGEDAGMELEITGRDRSPLVCKGAGANI